ncbi:carbohydrate ABC transporter permease [Paenibacillus paeoniae]|uniref:Carbohydrate ABC transporter permease n=2 Tax=Paenibacillus paeoniae TaxID=2292705 RepID=A0A371PHX8_9BACL|nr:carbohydrate ABC transporter permease [Paenibacillus paeoniae]
MQQKSVTAVNRSAWLTRFMTGFLWKLVRLVLLVGISYVILYPIILKISIAFKDKQDLYNKTVVWIPKNFTLDNFKLVLQVIDYPKVLLNTVLLSGGTMILQMITCALAGYAFAKLKFKGSNLLFILVVFTILVPPQTIMVPTYALYKNFDIFGIIELFTGKPGINLIGTYWPFIISSGLAMGLKTGLFIYIFRQFFRGIPKEIEEAAYMDGAGILTTFLRVMLPNAVPAIVTVMLFAFVWQWNDTYFSTLVLINPDLMSAKVATVAGQIASYLATEAGMVTSTGNIDPFYLSMLSNTLILLAILPLVVMYFFAQRYFVESVERTGLVG